MSGQRSVSHSAFSIGARLWKIATIPIDDYLPFGRIPGLLRPSYRVIVAASRLPPETKGLVRRVVQKTRLWRHEKRDVARELIAHFQDGLGSGRSTEELIASFGEVKQAARMIRRAKKRVRPVVWQVWKRGWQTIGCTLLLALVVYGVAAARLLLASPAVSHDYLADLNATAAAVPEADRAWPIYRAALMSLYGSDWEAAAPNVGVQPGDEGWKTMSVFLASNQPALALLREASAKPGLGFITGFAIAPEDQVLVRRGVRPTGEDTVEKQSPVTSPSENDNPVLMRVQLFQLMHLRRASLLCASDAFRAAEEKDGKTVVADLEAMIGMAEHVREIPMMIDDLVSISILTRAMGAAGLLLAEHPELFTDDDLTRLAHRFASFSGGGSIRVHLTGERIMFLDVLQHVYTDDGDGSGRITGEGLEFLRLLDQQSASFQAQAPLLVSSAEKALAPVRGFLMADRAEMLREYDALTALAAAETATPLWQRGESRIEVHLSRSDDSPLDRARYQPLLRLIPVFRHVSVTGELTTQMRDALLTAIALELYRRRHGAWPQSLQSLAPELLPTVPRDRFDGRPLKYRLIDGSPVLYSVGTDLDDDGGKPLDLGPRGRGRPGTYAARWLPPQRVEQLKRTAGPMTSEDWQLLPDADWILWPPPDSRFHP